jgi:hypothetical protein
MRARPSWQSILAKLTPEERRVLIDIENENVMKHFRCVSLRLYLAAVCALWDTNIIKYKSSKNWDKFLISLNESISGHAEMAYTAREGRKGGDMTRMARDMYEYIKGEGIQSEVMDQLYEQIMSEGDSNK